jgi:hypothetical protein
MVDYIRIEGKGLHDLYCDWTYALLEWVKRKEGEEALKPCLEYCKEVTSHAFYDQIKNVKTIEEKIQFFAEALRAHSSGPKESGNFKIYDDGEKVVIEVDPCGSGGRMRRGSSVTGSPSRLKEPFSLSATTKQEDWDWYMQGVPLYCLHCSIWHELMPLETGTIPTKFTNYVNDPAKPCIWVFYRKMEDIPAIYFHRIGYEKPKKPGEPLKKLSRKEALERLKGRKLGDSI